MSKYKFLVKLSLLFGILILSLAITPKISYAACPDNDRPFCDPGDFTPSGCASDCGIGNPCGTCIGDPRPNTCDRTGDSGWDFKYNDTCIVLTSGFFGATCDYIWQYITCSATDRCEGATGGGGTGYAANGHVLAGDCDASRYTGSNSPSAACINGGYYKQCCPIGIACSNGVCPGGQITSPGVTSCPVATSTPIPPPGATSTPTPGPTVTPIPTSTPGPTPTPGAGQVCAPGSWYVPSSGNNCGYFGCNTCDSAQCKSDGSGWNCVWNPGTCCPGTTATPTSPPGGGATSTPIPTLTPTPPPSCLVSYTFNPPQPETPNTDFQITASYVPYNTTNTGCPVLFQDSSQICASPSNPLVCTINSGNPSYHLLQLQIGCTNPKITCTPPDWSYATRNKTSYMLIFGDVHINQ